MENIPKITQQQIIDQVEMLGATVKAGSLNRWLDEQLNTLKSENPELYEFIIRRSKTLAQGVLMVHDPYSITVSMALEYVILLNLISAGFGREAGLKQFSKLMESWLGKDGLKGLDKFE